MGKKRHLQKQMDKRGLHDETALVICVGKHCCRREKSRALVDKTRAYEERSHADVPLVVVGCLDICKQGPIVALYPAMKFKRKVTPRRARKLVDKLERRRKGVR
jgi:(2Fe-2S) ferredoxin